MGDFRGVSLGHPVTGEHAVSEKILSSEMPIST
mgnify:CR=1 FL=1